MVDLKGERARCFLPGPFILSLPIFLCLSGPCWAGGSAPARSDAARQLAAEAGFQEKNLTTQPFVLKSWLRLRSPGQTLRVYIEGDGFAWNSHGEPSRNPTPKNPLALKLAVVDPFPNVAYLARPCQYIPLEEAGSCDEKYWSDARFSEEVVQSASQALDQLKALVGCERLQIVGYSGGAALALLVAARRQDIENIRTVAGALNPDAVNAFHGFGPLKGSWNPAAQAAQFKNIPQRHFVGEKDETVPPFIAQEFVRQIGPSACAEVTLVGRASHGKGWVEQWEELAAEPLPC